MEFIQCPLESAQILATCCQDKTRFLSYRASLVGWVGNCAHQNAVDVQNGTRAQLRGQIT